ncbi:MAG: sialate O-acetylesterase [Pirellulaceae bacterium]
MLSEEVQAGRINDKPLQKDAINADATQSSWIAGKCMLTVKGSNRLWGPWEGKHQVVEFQLAPKESRDVSLIIKPVPSEVTVELADLMRDPEDADIIVRSPRDYQVFQRHSLNAGPVLISGRSNVDCDSLRATISGTSLNEKEFSKTIDVNLDPETHAFTYSTDDFPAGGWYELKMEAVDDGKVVASQTVEHFGVGEVFVGAGQSNSTNSGQFKIEQTSNMVSSFSGTDWRIANDPQPGTHDRSGGGSYYPALGDLLYEKYKVPIGFAVTGHGGTSVNQWQPGDELHSWMMTRIHQLGPRGFRAVLWHQGESDVGMTTEEYYGKMKTIIVGSKQQAGWEFPWFVAQVSYHNPDKPSHETTRNAHAKLWADGVAMQGPDTDTLVGDDRDFDGKGIHFSPKGLKAHGKMWFEHLTPWLDRILK